MSRYPATTNRAPSYVIGCWAFDVDRNRASSSLIKANDEKPNHHHTIGPPSKNRALPGSADWQSAVSPVWWPSAKTWRALANRAARPFPRRVASNYQ